MEEKRTKRREWVKTVAIIFLIIMLVLTFFSQTIMNYSLPEVATQTVENGTLTSKIRGGGVVESGDPHVIVSKLTKTVESIPVRVGDSVKKGDVLIVLAEGESSEVEQAKTALEEARKNYETALLSVDIKASDILAAEKNIPVSTYRQQLTSMQDEYKKAVDDRDRIMAELADLEAKKTELEKQKTYFDNIENDAVSRETIAKTALDLVEKDMNNAHDALDSAIQIRDALEDSIEVLTVSGGDAGAIEELVQRKNAADAVVNDAQGYYDGRVNAYNDALNNYNNAVSEKEQAGLGKLQKTYELDLSIRNYQAEIEKKTAESISAEDKATEKGNKITEIKESFDRIMGIQSEMDGVERAKKELEKVQKDYAGGSIVADIDGVVTSINATSGKELTTGTEAVVIQPEGQQYTMSFTVTNDQAKKLSVGDKAEVINNWYYSDVEVTLAKIMPDKTEPAQKKMLVFNITGSINPGQTLNVSVGQKSADYDLIVPNSAIKEDGNGKFVLVVDKKSGPLGNRYIARRVDVEILANDDTRTAISGALYNYEFVVTTATKPVEAGKQVRLVEQ